MVLVCNGDYDAFHRFFYCTAYRGETGSWYLALTSNPGTQFRVNYLIAAA